MATIKRTHIMLNSVQKERVKSTKDYKVQHSTLLKACSNDGYHQPSQEIPENGNGSGEAEDYNDSFWDNENSNQSSCSCNEYDVLLRHLRTCPEPQLQLPQDITDLSVYYHDIEESIKTIQETIQDLSTDDLLTEVRRLSDFLTTDMSEMSQILEYITHNYDYSLTFFKSFEENLDKVKEVYVNYKLHLLVYLGLTALGVLLAVKIKSVFIKLV